MDRRSRPLGVGSSCSVRDRVLLAVPALFLDRVPHRDDYAAGQIRMLPVVQPDGKSTARRILVYSLLLIPVSLTPTLLGMSGRAYLIGALLLDAALLYVGWRLIALRAPLSAPLSKQRARQLLQATVLYLPLLFVLMMLSRISS